ncbi:MAG: adenosylmethionine decarboxylase [Epsilonproteobacteria bacterium]|nr:adenosylmethionine decarboxylase [Campylobacterota bacterium]
MGVLGTHILAEYNSCDKSILNNIQLIENSLLKAAHIAGATVVGSSFHRFEPQGVTGVVVLSESHISVHTWPELAYAAVDIFTCGNDVNPSASYTYLKEAFKSEDATSQTILRGNR